jgi:predicted RNA-binding protein with TRAM domain
MGFGRGGPDMPKPVKVGDELDVTIEAVAAKGDGIAKKDGFVIFVPGAAAGETCKIRVTALKASCAVAEKI